MVPAQEPPDPTIPAVQDKINMTTTAIWWIRRDFRLADNYALSAAQKAADSVLPVFIIDPVLQKRDAPARKAYLNGAIRGLGETIQAQGGRLILREGSPKQVLQELMAESGAKGIFAEEDTTPYARERDGKIAEELPLTLTQGLTALPQDAVRKSDGLPYTVYTPYSKMWKSIRKPKPISKQEPVRWTDAEEIASLTLPDDKAIFYQDALARLETFAAEKIYDYGDNRDRVDLDATSRLSPAFHLGLVSALQAVTLAKDAMENTDDPQKYAGAEKWLNEVIWREFYNSILYHFPRVRYEAFHKKYCYVEWRDAPAELRAWQEGQTGYPIVDAAMRQMNKEGWMHNRGRMIVASFLVKDLLIDWKLGEEYFMRQLIDGDVANNNGGWQWTAGVGTDAAPYFRIFNPVTQSVKFDPMGHYIRQYVPELANVPDKFIHEPWKMKAVEQREYGVKLGETYPERIVDHKFARQRTLDAYAVVKGISA